MNEASEILITERLKLYRSSRPEVFLGGKKNLKICSRTLLLKCDFNKVALQLY